MEGGSLGLFAYARTRISGPWGPEIVSSSIPKFWPGFERDLWFSFFMCFRWPPWDRGGFAPQGRSHGPRDCTPRALFFIGVYPRASSCSSNIRGELIVSGQIRLTVPAAPSKSRVPCVVAALSKRIMNGPFLLSAGFLWACGPPRLIKGLSAPKSVGACQWTLAKPRERPVGLEAPVGQKKRQQ